MIRTPAFCSRMIARLAAWRHSERASATLEFVIFLPVFITILVSSIETTIYSARQVMLERGLDIAVRDLRLGRMENPSHETLREAICDRTALLANCTNSLLLELQPMSLETWQGLGDPVQCINSDADEALAPNLEFTAGTQNELMLVHACVTIAPLFPLTGIAAALSRDAGGNYQLISSSSFVNEPG